MYRSPLGPGLEQHFQKLNAPARCRDVSNNKPFINEELVLTARFVAPGVLSFEDQASNSVALPFRGTWQSAALTGRKTGSDDDRGRALGALVGRWRLRGETNVMEVSPRGTYTWGKTEGAFEALSADRVRMRTLEHGATVGMLDCGLVLAEGQFTLVLPDASSMVFERMP